MDRPSLPRGPRIERISSRDNRWFRRFLRAAKRHDEEILLEGPKQIRDALERGWSPVAFATSGEGEAPEGAPAFAFSGELLRELSDTVHPQGLVALFERPAGDPASLFTASRPLIVVLDGVQDPGNVGTIIRLAAAFGATGVALTEGCADPWAPKTLRASVGTALMLPVVAIAAGALLGELERREIPLWATAAAGSVEASIRPPAAIVFGSEGSGVSPEMLRRARAVAIPMAPGVESINVASAAAIVLHAVYAASSS